MNKIILWESLQEQNCAMCPLTTALDILPLAKQILSLVDYSLAHPIRLLGLSVSNPLYDKATDSSRWIQLEFEWDE